MSCIFCNIAAGKIAADIVWRGETALAFLDHRPLFPGHVLLIPAGLARDNHSALMFLGGASLVGLSTANIYALVQRLSPDGEVGFSIGFMNLAGNLSGVAAPLVTGLIIARTGSYFPAFVVAVAALLAVLPIYWLMVKAPGKLDP